jgi:spore coat polysaccharide biosynthesis protein SpsF
MITAFIQARLGSTRFNSKIMQIIKGKTILEHIYSRVLQSKLIDSVYMVIPNNEPDLSTFCKDNNINYLEGNPEDVLSRFYGCNKIVNADHVVRITCDCPICDPKIIDALIKQHLKENNNYTSNNYFNEEEFADGFDVEIISKFMLSLTNYNAEGIDRLHVTSYIRNNKDIYNCGKLKNKYKYKEYNHLRLTIDYPKDLTLIETLYDKLYEKNNYFGQKEIIELYNKEPEIFDINKEYKRNESFIRKK